MTDLTPELQERIAREIIGWEVYDYFGTTKYRIGGVDRDRNRPRNLPAADSWLFLGPLQVALIRQGVEFDCHQQSVLWRLHDWDSWVRFDPLPDAILAAAIAKLEARDDR